MMSSSKPRPIHQTPDLRTQPDENEPSFSYERESFLLGSKELDVEDEFHQRLQASSNRNSASGGGGGSGSFWRTSSDQLGPSAFQSMKMSTAESPKNNNGSVALQTTTSTATSNTSQQQSSLRIQSTAPGGVETQTEGYAVRAQREKMEQRNSTKGKKQMSEKNAAAARARKETSKQRNKDRQMKLEAQNSDLDLGHLEDYRMSADSNRSSGSASSGTQQHHSMSPPVLIPPTEGTASRSSSDHSGSLLYGKTRTGVLLGKSSSLIFPTGVEANGEEESDSTSLKRRKINLLLDQCETVRFPFKKKLILDDLKLSAADIPVKDLCGTSLGNTLSKLSLSGNHLSVIPPKLVQNLPMLKHLDLSQCDLVKLPERWYLPMLKKLNLSHNRITEFPDEVMLEGLPELQDLDMYGNKVAEIIVPRNPRLLSRLETLNLGYNELVYLPEDLDQLRSLRTLKVMNNFLEKVPMRICDMEIRVIDVSSNPVIQPPQETCDRGICSMKRYYDCLRKEEQSKHQAVAEVQKKLMKKTSKTKDKKSKGFRFFKSPTNSGSFNSKSCGSAGNSGKLETKSTVPPKVVREEPAILPSKIDNPVMGMTRQRSVSFDAGMTANKPSLASDVLETVATVVKEDDVVKIDDANPTEAVATEISPEISKPEDVTVNDTLKVIFVGMAMAGKTSMIKRLIEGKDAVIPQRDDRTIGVDIYEWDARKNQDRPPVDTKIMLEDEELVGTLDDQHVKFSVWDFAGQHVYHATHELFFSPRSLYVLVWDMGATNQATQKRKAQDDFDQGAFKLSYDSSDEEDDDDDFQAEEEARRADRALERDIDEKVQFWVECIQSCAPGAAILPVATFNDYFEDEEEAKRRCKVMKQRLIKHEERRLAGIRERLKEYVMDNRANDEGALRLRKLLCPYTRPKFLFGDDSVDDSVVRVSGTKYSGFEKLTDKIVNVSTGRDKCGSRWPMFRGHIGARIPRMRLEVRSAVRNMRDRFKVVEWGYFLSYLRDEHNLTTVEDISDALHFLTNIGELSYFGNVFPDKHLMEKLDPKTLAQYKEFVGVQKLPQAASNRVQDKEPEVMLADDDDDDDDDIEDTAILSMDDTSMTMPTTEDSASFGTFDEAGMTGLSQYVYLNPRWLVAAVACILRHDLDREIRETRRFHQKTIDRQESFYSSTANLNCPIITAEDAKLLWQAKKFTKKAADRAQEYSNNMQVSPFDFLQRLLVRFGVFVPIDLSIEKALLGGKEYARAMEDDTKPMEIVAVGDDQKDDDTPQFFFLPSLLGPGEPAEAWTYKNTDSWKTTLCHSILFPDGVPPGLMERITAAVMSSIYAVSKGLEKQVVITSLHGQSKALDGPLRVKEMICWRTAFFLKLGSEVKCENGESKESVVEIFVHLADRESHLCVGSDEMGAGMRRLIISGKGQVGDGGRKIWSGGYLLVIKAVGRVMSEYEGLEFEKHGFCPECLSKVPVSQASHWDWTVVRSSARNGDDTMRCRHGHRVDTRLITGPIDSLSKQKSIEPAIPQKFTQGEPSVPVQDLLRSIVLVGLWDGKSRKVVRVGSGFVVDKKRGLIVTASHTLMNIWGDKNSPFGENYYGLREGKVVIGVIPRKKATDGDQNPSGEAVFRYFASIVAKDPSIDEKGECHLDACVLRITTRMENDVAGDGDGCGDQPEILLQHNTDALKREKLQQLKITDKCELDEQVRILGYNQGGEGLRCPGESLNRFVDFARGYVCKKFATGEMNSEGYRHRFKPREEIVVMCPTIGGHSGGPCVNQQGEVVGILSRADPAENQRCYLVPTTAWKSLVRQAKALY